MTVNALIKNKTVLGAALVVGLGALAWASIGTFGVLTPEERANRASIKAEKERVAAETKASKAGHVAKAEKIAQAS